MSYYDDLPESTIYEGLQHLLEIPDDVWKQLLQAIQDYSDDHSLNLVPAVGEIAVEHDLNPRAIDDAISSAITTASIKYHHDISFSEALAEPVAAEAISEDQIDTIVERLEGLDSHCMPALGRMLGRREIISSSFPVFDAIVTRCTESVSMTPGFIRRAHIPEGYNPEVGETVPTAIVRLRIDHFGDQETTTFAVDSTQLTEIINHLRLAKKELDVYSEKSE